MKDKAPALLKKIIPFLKSFTSSIHIEGKGSFRGARKLMGENLKVVWAEFSTLS
jgi:hypothetical protein